MHVLDYDGGLVDASCASIIAALQHFRRPDVSIDGENVTIYAPAEREPVPLSLVHHPICVTFSFYQGERSCLWMLIYMKSKREKVK